MNLAERGRYLEHVMRHGRVDDFEAEMLTSSGRKFWASLSGQRLRFAGDEALLAAIVDVTAQRQVREDLLAQATHDPLTGSVTRHENGIAVQSGETGARPVDLGVYDTTEAGRRGPPAAPTASWRELEPSGIPRAADAMGTISPPVPAPTAVH